jgi:hypothetical protein
VRRAQLEDSGSGLTFESEHGDPPVEFARFGIDVTVLEPGRSGLHHAEPPIPEPVTTTSDVLWRQQVVGERSRRWLAASRDDSQARPST